MIRSKKNIIVAFVFIILLVAFYIYNGKKNRIVRRAKKFVGKEETANNQGFIDKKFENELKKIGWYNGAEWCSFFARKIYLDSLTGKQKEVANRLISGSSQQTWQNFLNDKSNLFFISKKPQKGALVIWQSQKEPSRGHVGIVTKANDKYFETVEGNTNQNGSAGIVAKKKYNLITENLGLKNLKLLGFIIPK